MTAQPLETDAPLPQPGPATMPGDRVRTPRGYGTVTRILRDWDQGICDAAWAYEPPPRYQVRLFAGGEDVFPGADLVRLPAAGTCDP